MCYCRCWFAAPSNTSDLAAVAPSRTSETTVDSEHSSIYEVVKELEKTQGFADLQAKYKDLADAFKQINDGTMIDEDTGVEKQRLLRINFVRLCSHQGQQERAKV